MTTQMKKGVLELCILHLIAHADLYGYEIMKRITSVFADTNESTVYAILRRLLADGYLVCHSHGDSGGPPRKYYKVTALGEGYLRENLKGWNDIVDGVEKIIKA